MFANYIFANITSFAKFAKISKYTVSYYNGARPKFCSHYSPKLTENSQWTRTKLLSAVRGVTSTGISIVNLRNEGFHTFCLCLTTGRHLGFTEKLRNSPSRRMFANSFWGNVATAFSLSLQFHVCDRTCYKLYSGKREKENGSVAKLWASNIWFHYCAIFVGI